MNDSVCVLTGASGCVGSRCEAVLGAAGWQIRRAVRHPRGAADFAFDLRGPIDPAIFRSARALVHCAHDFAVRSEAESERVNVEGSRRLLLAAREAGVERIVFVSSASAFDGCRSRYGRHKRDVEKLAARLGAVSLRLGLVWGVPGKGIFGRLARLARLPVVPVLDGGRQPFVLVHADDAALAVRTALEWPPGTHTDPLLTAHPERLTLVEILQTIAATQGRRLRTVSVPAPAAHALLAAAEAARLPLPFHSDSLVSLLHPNPALDCSVPEHLFPPFRRFRGLTAAELQDTADRRS